jgi:hypothetical protein
MSTNKEAAETIAGTYFTMPDGQLLEKLSNGEWVSVANRIKQAEQSITERFKGTDTVPSEWTPATSVNVTRKKVRVIEDVIKVSSTHRHLHAHLIEIMGSPTEIIKNGKLPETIKKKTVNDYHIKRSVEQIIKALDCEPWNSVLKIMNGEPV